MKQGKGKGRVARQGACSEARLVEHEDLRRLRELQVVDNALHRADVLQHKGRGGVDHVQDEVGLLQLLERGAEGGDLRSEGGDASTLGRPVYVADYFSCVTLLLQ